MDFITAVFVIGTLMEIVGCGSSGPSSRSDREKPLPDDGGAEGGVDGPQPLPKDGGDTDADAMLPPRHGIRDNWAEFEDCVVTDSDFSDERLLALCEGNPHRLLACEPAGRKLEPAVCENFVAFEEQPFLDDKPLTIRPLVHDTLNGTHSLVTFTSIPDNYPGFFVVDRTTQTITDQQAWETPGIRVGSDIIEFPSNLCRGAALLGDNLVIACSNRDFSASEESYLGGIMPFFSWNGDGTVSIPEEAELGVAFRFTNGLNPTLFWPEAGAAKVLHNWHRGGASPIDSGWDRITLNEDGAPTINSDDFQSLGQTSFEPFKHFAANPDNDALFLASSSALYIYQPASHTLSSPFEWEGGRVVAAAWRGADQLFFAVAEGRVHSASIADGRVVSLSGEISTLGEPVSLVMDRSAGILYLAEIRDRETSQSAITAMLDSVFDVE